MADKLIIMVYNLAIIKYNKLLHRKNYSRLHFSAEQGVKSMLRHWCSVEFRARISGKLIK